MHWIVVDIDQTLADTKELVEAGGVEPPRGTEEHKIWVEKVTDPESLASAIAIETVVDIVSQFMDSMFHRVVFITNRRNNRLMTTKNWLYKHGLLQPLFVREMEDNRDAGDYKASQIKALIQQNDIVTIIDDDPDGTIERECRANNWTHLKVTTF